MTRRQPDNQRTVRNSKQTVRNSKQTVRNSKQTVRNFMLLTMSLVAALPQRTDCRPTDAGLSTDLTTKSSPDHPHSQHLRTPRTWNSLPPEPLRRPEAGPQTRNSTDGGAKEEQVARSLRQRPRRTRLDFSNSLRNKDVKNDKKQLPIPPEEQAFDRRALPGFRSETTTDDENQLLRSLFEQFTRGGGHSGSQQRRRLNVKAGEMLNVEAEEVLSVREKAFRGQSSSTIQKQILDFRDNGKRQTLPSSRLRPVRQEESPTTSYSILNKVTRKVQNLLSQLTQALPTGTHSKIHSIVEGNRNIFSALPESSQRLPRGVPWGTWRQGKLEVKADVEKPVLSLRELVGGRWASRQPEAEEDEDVGEKHGPSLSDEPQHKGGHSEPQHNGGHWEPQHKGGHSEPQHKGGHSEPQHKGGHSEPQHKGGHSEPQHKRGHSGRRRRRQCCMDGWATHH